MKRSGVVIVLLGPPGAGKGTQAERLSSALDIPTISTGEMLRQECKSGSQLGAQVQNLLNSGQLVKDELMYQVVEQRLSKSDCTHGCILDGFPRTAAQARFLDQLLAKLSFQPPVIFDLSVRAEELISRLGSRRQCPGCGRTFQVLPGSGTVNCPTDGLELVQRADDNPATIRERLRVYSANMGEIVRFYQTKDYHVLNASQPAENITHQMLGVLGTVPSSTKNYKLAVLGSRPVFASVP